MSSIPQSVFLSIDASNKAKRARFKAKLKDSIQFADGDKSNPHKFEHFWYNPFFMVIKDVLRDFVNVGLCVQFVMHTQPPKDFDPENFDVEYDGDETLKLIPRLTITNEPDATHSSRPSDDTKALDSDNNRESVRLVEGLGYQDDATDNLPSSDDLIDLIPRGSKDEHFAVDDSANPNAIGRTNDQNNATDELPSSDDPINFISRGSEDEYYAIDDIANRNATGRSDNQTVTDELPSSDDPINFLSGGGKEEYFAIDDDVDLDAIGRRGIQRLGPESVEENPSSDDSPPPPATRVRSCEPDICGYSYITNHPNIACIRRIMLIAELKRKNPKGNTKEAQDQAVRQADFAFDNPTLYNGAPFEYPTDNAEGLENKETPQDQWPESRKESDGDHPEHRILLIAGAGRAFRYAVAERPFKQGQASKAELMADPSRYGTSSEADYMPTVNWTRPYKLKSRDVKPWDKIREILEGELGLSCYDPVEGEDDSDDSDYDDIEISESEESDADGEGSDADGEGSDADGEESDADGEESDADGEESEADGEESEVESDESGRGSEE